MKKNLISIIIPAKNRAEFVRQSVSSVVNQQLDRKYKLEIILVDNDSEPPLKTIFAKEFPHVSVTRFTRYHHPGASRNHGLTLATGEFIAFLDSDDIWDPRFLSTSIKILNNQDGPATMSLNNPFFNQPYPALKRLKLISLNLIWRSFLLLSWALNDGKLIKSGFYLCQISHMLFKSTAIKGIKFNQTAVASEDWEFVSDVTQDKEVLIVPQSLVSFRYELRSNTNKPEVSLKKGQAYLDLISKLPKSHKTGLLYRLFRLYIKIL